MNTEEIIKNLCNGSITKKDAIRSLDKNKTDVLNWLKSELSHLSTNKMDKRNNTYNIKFIKKIINKIKK